MKATKYFAAIVLLLGLVSCQPAEFNTHNSADSDQVEVTFSVQFPEPVPVPTKARMGEGPVNTEENPFDIHLCVYGPGEGFVQNWITASLVSTTTDAAGYVTQGTFKALLPIAADERKIHIIANPPKSVTPTTLGYLDNVMEKMVTLLHSKDESSYWQEIILPKIDAAQNSGTNPPQASSAVNTAFSNIHLLRNYAKVIVTSPDESEEDYHNFELKRWTLINVPDRGYVAPYTRIKTDEGRFPKGYRNDFLKAHASLTTFASDLYNQLTQVDQYPGYMPPEARIIDTYPGDPNPDPDGEDTIYVKRGQALYMYERPLPKPEMPEAAILVEIEFKPGNDLYNPHSGEGLSPEALAAANTYWYKIEILNDEGNYVPFFRDIVYTLRLTKLPEIGASSAEEAFNDAYFGNISASLETAGLGDLSNGTSAIHVDRLDYTFLTGSEYVILTKDGTANPESDAAQFYFKPNVSQTNTYWKTEPGVCIIDVTKRDVPDYAHAVTYFSVEEGGVLKVLLADMLPGDGIKKSVIRVLGRPDTPNSLPLYREITINLMPVQKFAHGDNVTRITNTPVVDAVNKDVNFVLELPAGLGASVFPIQVRIEAKNNTLSAITPDLPVRTGASVFDPTRNTFYFIFTVNYADYCHLNPLNKKYEYTYHFPFTMKTSKRSGNATPIDLRDLDGRFEPMTLNLETVVAP